MRIAFLGDIHSNLEAFVKTLEHIDRSLLSKKAKPINRIICLGDVIGYGSQSKECIELAIERCEEILEGNHERGVRHAVEATAIDLREKGLKGPGAVRSVYWNIWKLFGDTTLKKVPRVQEAKEYTHRLLQCVLADDYAGQADDKLREVIAAGLPKPGLFESKIAYGQRVVEYMLSGEVQKLREANKEGIDNVCEGKRLLKVMRSWPTHNVIELGEYKVLITHDNPVDPGDGMYVIPPDSPLFDETSGKYTPNQIFDMWDEHWPDINVIISAHLHDPFIEEDPDKKRFQEYERRLINTGSVGVPRVGDKATYLVMNPEAKRFPFRIERVDGIDWQSTGQQWENVGLVNVFDLDKLGLD